jgi:hypothetical protein
MWMAVADAIAGTGSDPPRSEPFLLAPPKEADPVVVRAGFVLHDINEINDGSETFEFAGVLTLKWRDPRQAFDPAIVGVDEKIFQGDFQFNELSTGWYPQVVLVNESGLYQTNGVVLRVQPDGTSTLIETLNAAAKSEVNMIRFPFDGHRLEAVFEVLGFDKDEVLLWNRMRPRSWPPKFACLNGPLRESVRRSGVALHPTPDAGKFRRRLL